MPKGLPLATIACLLALPLAAAETATKLPPSTATPVESIQAPEGFKVERLYSVPSETQGSWVSLTVDNKGRLITSDQYGALYRTTPPPIGTQGEAKVERLKTPIGEAHGLLYALDSLFVTVNEGKQNPAGVYRLRDTDGDDQFDEVKLLRRIEGGGEHGPHAVVLSPDLKSLYVIAGNFTKIPQPERSAVPRVWAEDQLLPRLPDAGGHDPHIKAPAGWVARMNLDGSGCELVGIGMRNTYDMAFNHEGDLFGYDSDMEWDIGAPWYRPTRVCHLVSGADWGWRNGSGKFPVYYPETLPPVVDIGPGSPTGMTFGYGAKFPAKYQEALFLLDWSYGIIYAAHLSPKGSSYTATFEKFVTGAPLPLTDVVIGPDGAMYFTIGGRKTQSGLYRITYVGTESTAPAKIPADPAAREARALRRRLEAFHGHADPQAVKEAWPHLGDADRFIRAAARIAVEHQPVHQWQQRALDETQVQPALTALLALVRCGDKSVQPKLLAALGRVDWTQLSEPQRLELLRVYGLAFARMGKPGGDVRAALAAKISTWFPVDTVALNRELSTLLVYLDAPDAVGKILELLAKAPTQEEQIHYAMVLREAKGPWTLDQRTAYFTWFHRAADFRGGHSFAGFIRNIKNDAMATLSGRERQALAAVLVERPAASLPLEPLRKVVKEYTLDDLLPLVESGLKQRNFENGRAMYSAAQCSKCHRFDLDGGIGGPDLTGLAGRFSNRDLLESIVDPSKVVSDQYQATIFVMQDGLQITGRITNQGQGKVMITPNLLAPDEVISVPRDEIDQMVASKQSMMPNGLLNTLTEDEILDLVAYLHSRGDKNHPAFR